MDPDPPRRPATHAGTGPESEGSSRTAPLALVAAGMVLLIAVVVALASEGGDLGGGPSVVIGQGLAGLFLGGLTLLLALGLGMWWLRLRHRQLGPRRSRRRPVPWWLRSIVSLLMLLMLVLVFSWVSDRNDGPSFVAVTTTAVTQPPETDGGGSADGVGVSGLLVTGVLVAIAAAAIVLARVRHRLLGAISDVAPTDDDDPDDPADEAVRGALAASVVDLEGVRDPRRAVIAAYVRMQNVLAAAGTQRRSTETELDFLARVLARLGGDGEPARSLTELFALARYSEHPIDEAMRTEAVAAVRELQNRLAVSR